MEIRLDYSKKLVYGINCKIPSCLTDVNISPLILLLVRDLANFYHLYSLPAEGKLILIIWVSREIMFDNLPRFPVWLNIFSLELIHFLTGHITSFSSNLNLIQTFIWRENKLLGSLFLSLNLGFIKPAPISYFNETDQRKILILFF